METKKEIFVLSGAGHKGSVKITGPETTNNRVKIECNLDFRPTNATLYIVGDEIAKTELNNSKTTLELPFLSKTILGCVVRTSSITMFGGRGNKSEILAKIDGERRQIKPSENSKNHVRFEQKPTQNSILKQELNISRKHVVNLSQTAAEKALRNETEQKRHLGDTIGVESDVKSESSTLARLLSETATSTGVLKYNGSNFYLAIKPQLDEMFVCYKQETSLANAVENSSWVHIDAEDGYYVVGIVKDGDTPLYICYGVPSKDGNDVPPELKNVCVWLPVDDENVKGYWVIYQSAIDGEIVK